MLILLVGFIFSVSQLATNVSATNERVDRARDGLIGKVKKVVEESGSWEKGSTILALSTTYDLLGNIIETEISRYKAGGSAYPERLKTNYERNAEGKITARRSFDETGALQSQVIHTYDDEAHRTEETHFGRDGQLLLKVAKTRNEGGKEEETKTFLSDGTLKSKWRAIFDKKGNLVEYLEFTNCAASPDCAVPKHRAVNAYDSHGNMIESLIFKADGNLNEKRVYRYDSVNQRIVEQTTFAADGSLKKKERYTYNVDKVGNWIEKVTSEFDANSHLKETSKTRRKITYFPSH